MKFIFYLLVGILFGITLTKGEVISWFRIQEMFRFHSFHMYGVIGTAVLLGMGLFTYLKRNGIKSFGGQPLYFPVKAKSTTRYLVGGIFFGLGWAMTGACPGPIYTLIGSGLSVFILVLLSALLGTFVYGVFQNRLPH